MTIPTPGRWVITLTLVTAVIALSTVPGRPQPGDANFVWLVAATPAILQKAMHILIYGLMACLWVWTLEESIASRWLRPAVAFLLAVGLGATLEWYQTQIPGRFGTLFDVVLNSAGVIAGLVIAALVL